MFDDGRTRHIMWVLPAGASALMRATSPGQDISVPLWGYWLQIAEEAAEAANEFRASDAKIDALSGRLAGADIPVPDEPERDRLNEMQWSMVAISASAHAVDGLYSSVKGLVSPPKSGAARKRQILETLKLGFQIGKWATAWRVDLDWLFDTRDNIVHHAEERRPVVIARLTDQTAILGGPESFNLSALQARRAANIAGEVIRRCLDFPKTATEEWAVRRQEFIVPSSKPAASVVESGALEESHDSAL